MKMLAKIAENNASQVEFNAGCEVEEICTQKGESHTRRQISH